MMNQERIDFTSLDPTRQRAKWDARIDFVVRSAVASHRKRTTVEGQLLLWARPMLAVAATVALVGTIAVTVTERPKLVTKSDPAMEIITWAARDDIPSTEAVMTAFGDAHVTP
jgi:hypothetical protein